MVSGKMFAPGVPSPEADGISLSVFGKIGADALSPAEKASLWRGVIYDDGDKPVASGDIWYDGDFVIGSLCVLKTERRKGYGDLLVRLLLYKAQTHFAKKVRLDATPETVSFFARYGFCATSGTQMEIEGSKIELDGCKGCSAC
ncbi:MAG: GNAT family N-acetyltransferase [Eubacteriales bacterium]|nr:GNAT family N-acetyltransferase [Eubacteriales bacterium]MDD3881007.1 GNAT family N-acetyltransferase [Eubacteriales bacterium]MDD4511924.1 GNAT family N-acetyltransferase [Eubacteriales bacterium]